MDFKERFKGRSTTVSKEGITHTLAAPSNNPVQKSQYNNPVNSSSKSFAPNTSNDFQDSRISRTRLSQEKPAENRPIMPQHPETHFYSKTPIHQHQPMNDSPNYPRYMPSNSAPNTANKNPYLVNNPFPQIDSLDNHFNNTYNNNMRNYNYQNTPDQGRAPQEVLVSHFNPNSFYNQHSQYKNGPTGMTPKKDGSENQPVYKAASTSQLVKKNFENLSLQNRQKRGEEPVRGFDFQYRPPHSSNNRLEGLNHLQNNYDPHNYGMPPPMLAYNGPRDIHSNPVPHQNYIPHNYGQFPQNMTYQFERGTEQNSVPNRLYNNNGSGMIRSLSNTGTNYKPLTLKDVKELKNKAPIKLGGLGPNTNTDEWFKQKEKKDKMSEFSQNVKMFNAQRISNTETNFKARREKEKDKSRREIALEFAKNIPKPRVRSHQPDEYYVNAEGTGNELDLDSMNPNDLDEFEQRHRLYKAQLGKMNLY